MDSKEVDYRDWLDTLTPKIIAKLGNGFDDVRYEVATPGDSFFLSDMLFVNITANSASNGGKARSFGVVIKKPSSTESLRVMSRMDEQFHNEILFYERYGKGCPGVPRCIYAEEKPPVDTVIVLENVITQRGYDLCQWKCDVPLEYTVAAFREIARFHGRAYTMKECRRDEFFDIVKNIRETRYCPDSVRNITFNATATRSIEYLRKHGYDERFCDKLGAQLEDAFGNVIVKMVEPEEPLATICHGDFTINNTFFKKDNGELNVMFVDFALMRYGSPVLDLSTYMCLHCAKDIDKDMLDHVLRVYHDSLTDCLVKNGVDCEMYTYEALREDYKKKGLFGFFISTFFLAMQMGKCDTSPQEFAELDLNKAGAVLREAGGDEVSEILANMLLKLKQFGCLDYLL